MEFAADPRPDTKIVKLIGPITFHNLSGFQEFVQRKPMPGILIVDLSHVPYIDSAALGILVSMHVARDGTGSKYALVGANERLRNLFDLAYVSSFLNVFDSVAEAEAYLTKV
jgi:anti-sigma B factor antagonist